jgi:hypothetical protein
VAYAAIGLLSAFALLIGAITATDIGVHAGVDDLQAAWRVAITGANQIHGERHAVFMGRHQVDALFHAVGNGQQGYLAPVLMTVHRQRIGVGQTHRRHGVEQPHEAHPHRDAAEGVVVVAKVHQQLIEERTRGRGPAGKAEKVEGDFFDLRAADTRDQHVGDLVTPTGDQGVVLDGVGDGFGIFTDQLAAMADSGDPVGNEQHGKADPTVTHRPFSGAVGMGLGLAYLREAGADTLNIAAVYTLLFVIYTKFKESGDIAM